MVGDVGEVDVALLVGCHCGDHARWSLDGVNPVGWKGKPRAGEARDDALPQAGEMACDN
jgi:hypothetical protein